MNINEKEHSMTELTIDPELFAQIELKKGAHSNIDEGACLMEAVSFLAREQFSDHPKCVSPVLGTFGRNLNDVLPDALRQELKSLIPSLPGTADDGMDETRGYMALDWLIRTWLPVWLDLVPATREDARKLRELGRIVDLVAAERAGPVVRESQKNAAAAWDAAWDAARAAARDAAGDAAGAAAGAAARDAAWAAARDAAGAAAWDAAWDAARAAARDAAGDAAWDAARDAARAAARDAAWAAARDAAGAAARDAAGDAARDAAWAAARDAATKVLAPSVEELQRSAIELYRDMIKAPH